MRPPGLAMLKLARKARSNKRQNAGVWQYGSIVEHAAQAEQVVGQVRENFIVHTTNTFISFIFLREESSRQS